MNEYNEYIKIPKTINLLKANVFAIIIMVPITLVYLIPFYFIWNETITIANLKTNLKSIDFTNNSLSSVSITFIVLVIGIIIHELIHGISWSIYATKGFTSIKFGVLWKMLTPYCHCKEPLTVNAYIIGAVMPAIILGFIPAIIAMFIGNVLIIFFALIFTIVAVGDFMIINLIRKEPKDSLILDHPSEAGYFVLQKK